MTEVNKLPNKIGPFTRGFIDSFWLFSPSLIRTPSLYCWRRLSLLGKNNDSPQNQ